MKLAAAALAISIVSAQSFAAYDIYDDRSHNNWYTLQYESTGHGCRSDGYWVHDENENSDDFVYVDSTGHITNAPGNPFVAHVLPDNYIYFYIDQIGHITDPTGTDECPGFLRCPPKRAHIKPPFQQQKHEIVHQGNSHTHRSKVGGRIVEFSHQNHSYGLPYGATQAGPYRTPTGPYKAPTKKKSHH